VLEDLSAQRREEAVGLARDDEVDPVERGVRRVAHASLAVGSAHHGHDAGIELADTAQQRKRGAVLLEHRRAADNPRTARGDAPREPVDEPVGATPHFFEHRRHRRARMQRANLEEVRHRRVISDEAEERVVIGLEAGKRGARERPFANQVRRERPIREPVHVESDLLGPRDVRVENRGGDARVDEIPLEQPERDRRTLHRRVRHLYQNDIAHHGAP